MNLSKDKTKLFAGFIFALIMVLQGIFFLAVSLSFYKWSPLGYEPSGLQVLFFLFLAVFCLITASINFLIFWGDEIGFAFKTMPFCLAVANVIYFIFVNFTFNFFPNYISILNLTLIAFFILSYLYCITRIVTTTWYFYQKSLFSSRKSIALLGIILQCGVTFSFINYLF